MIKDSGERTVFESGSVRDMKIGKGKCDLLPMMEVCDLLEYEPLVCAESHKSPLRYVSLYIYSAKAHPFGEGEESFIYSALYRFAREVGWDIPTMIIEVSKHFEEGAMKYNRNNWRAGIPASSYLDSGIRHYLKWKRGDNDENHDRAFVWNMLCMIWTVRNKPEFNDIADIEKVQVNE